MISLAYTEYTIDRMLGILPGERRGASQATREYSAQMDQVTCYHVNGPDGPSIVEGECALNPDASGKFPVQQGRVGYPSNGISLPVLA